MRLHAAISHDRTDANDRAATFPGRLAPQGRAALRLVPGLVLTAAVAWAGLRSSEWLGTQVLGFEKSPISGIMMAIVIGLLVGNSLTLPGWTRPGIQFSLKKILRLGIIFLGIRLSLADVVRLGALGVPLILFCLSGALLVARWLGQRLKLSPPLSALIAVGTSICGATAIVATAPVIEADEEETTYAVANITLFGLLAMLFYPYLAHGLFANDMTHAGLFLGTAIHETAQVAGSGLIYAQLYDADTALEAATVTKLVRNLMMIGVIPLIAYLHQQQSNTAEDSTSPKLGLFRLFPVFVLGFVLLALVRSAGDAALDADKTWGAFNAANWDTFTTALKDWAENFLAMAMAAVGLGTSFKKLRGLGLRPFYVGLGAALVVGLLSLVGITILSALGLG